MPRSTVLVVTELVADGLRHANALAPVAEVALLEGTAHVLAVFLETRPDLVVLDPLTDLDEAGTIIRQLAPVGFGNTAVPFVVVVDGAEDAARCLDAGAHDTVRRDEAGSGSFAARVQNALDARELAVRARRERRELVDAVLASRSDAPA